MNERNKIFEDNLLPDFIVNPEKRIYRHLLMFLFLALLMLNNPPECPNNMDSDSTFLIAGAVILCLCIGIIYLNLYFLVPHLLFKNSYGRYFLSVFLIITLLFLMFFLFILASSRFSSFDRGAMQETGDSTFGFRYTVSDRLSGTGKNKEGQVRIFNIGQQRHSRPVHTADAFHPVC